MKKSEIHIAKEVFILIILFILIMLVLAVSLYDFIPSNINIPEPIEYSADKETTSIKQEIAYTNSGDKTADEKTERELVTSLKSYSIEASDLTVYGEKHLYNSGNSNPFDYAEEAVMVQEPKPEETTTQNTAAVNNTANSAETTASTGVEHPTSGTSTGTFFESSTSK